MLAVQNSAFQKLFRSLDGTSQLSAGDVQAISKVLGIVSIVPIPDEWNSAITYQKLNLVRYQGAAYLARQSNLNVVPPTPPANNDSWLYLFTDPKPAADQAAQSAQAAADSATAAANSSTAASESASAAQKSAEQAAASEGNAATSASNASTSEQNAAASAESAASAAAVFGNLILYVDEANAPHYKIVQAVTT